MYDYDKTCLRFLEVNCRIIDSKEEYDENNKGTRFPKCNYIASCGHNHIVFINGKYVIYDQATLKKNLL